MAGKSMSSDRGEAWIVFGAIGSEPDVLTTKADFDRFMRYHGDRPWVQVLKANHVTNVVLDPPREDREDRVGVEESKLRGWLRGR